jgi:alanyl-tRNA synthetase
MKNLELMKSTDVRAQFIDYFKKNQHTAVNSSSLIPEKDPTLLFTNAGMNQFKNLFLGLEQRDYLRAVSSQKCVRAGGKHNDLENVGFTARHHTFFEMLGNFSFGDYFKKDAIHFAWELLTKNLGIPKERLYVTVFENDDEAADLWHKQEGIPREKIFRFGEKDNFWRMGETGPCGPCTEIFYDHGENAGPETDAYKGILSGGDRYVEIWNLVMMQYFEKEPGIMEPLPKPSVDTGAGLERLCAVMQGKINNYDTDLFMPLIESALRLIPSDSSLAELVHHQYTGKVTPVLNEKLAALRVLADHTRSVAFLLTDGAVPSNEGRGYVLRRILRRALRYQRKLSPTASFFPSMINSLVTEMGNCYPELRERKDYVLNVVHEEENRFTQTLDQGTELLNVELARLKSSGQKTLPGEVVFKLYDTYGFPVDLTRLMAQEQSFLVDESGFDKEMQTAREKAKFSWKGKSLNTDEAHLLQWSNGLAREKGVTQFNGYEQLNCNVKVVGISDGLVEVNSLKAGSTGILVTQATTFYAEGGGQVGDKGNAKAGPTEVVIHNTTKLNDIYLHHVEVTKGELKIGTEVLLAVSESERRQTASNHSATHLLHAALRKVLGNHVTQAGSLVDPTRLRFDFTHAKALTPGELQAVEVLVNTEIAKGLPIQGTVKSHETAIKEGAMALFGEKYGNEVRVVKMGDFSQELCGGTHIGNTAQIRLVKIVSETGVSAGVRRLEALSGDGALSLLNKHYQQSQVARDSIGAQESWSQFLESDHAVLTQWIEEKKLNIKNLEKEIKDFKKGQINIEAILASAKNFKKGTLAGRYVVAILDIDDRELLAQITDQIKNRIECGVVVSAGLGVDSHPVIIAATKNLIPAINAGQMLKDLSQRLGGKGGGRPDFAQGAIVKRDELADTLASYLNS